MHLTNCCGAGIKGFVTGDWGMPEGVDLLSLHNAWGSDLRTVIVR